MQHEANIDAPCAHCLQLHIHGGFTPLQFDIRRYLRKERSHGGSGP
jgi:hypothetical protein